MVVILDNQLTVYIEEVILNKKGYQLYMTPNKQNQMSSLIFAELEQAMERPIIKKFLADPVNMALFKKYVQAPSTAQFERVNQAFKVYVFAVRFTKYLASLIHNGRIDYVRRLKRNEEREMVIYDKPISEDEETAIGEMLGVIYQGDDLPQVTVDPEVFQGQLNNEWLYEGFSRLTSRQKYVITLAYSAMSRDIEIARLLHVSQQSIFKTRMVALRNMRKAFPVTDTAEGIPLQLGG